MGMWRKFVAVLVSVTLVLGLNPTAAFATTGEGEEGEQKTINYVSIGDSMTNGYCFTGYNQGGSTGDSYDFLEGVGVYGSGAYPLQFEEYLEGQGYEVNHTKLAPSATLAGDLWYVLGGRDLPLDGWGGMFDYVGEKYRSSQYRSDVDYNERCATPELMSYYQNAVKDADLMTLCLGNAEFGAYLMDRLTTALGLMGAKTDPEDIVTLQDALNYSGLDAEQQALVQDAYDYLVGELKGYVSDELWGQYNLSTVCDMLAYATAGFVFNYKGVLDTILEMNPDVEIIQIGLMNTTYGMTVSLDDGSAVPVGDIMDGLFESLNAYIAALPTVMQASGEWDEATFYYTNQPRPLFISQQFAALKNANWTVVDNGRLDGTTVRTRNITAFNETFVDTGLLNGAFKTTLPRININDVQKYEKDDMSFAATNEAKVYSVMVYLALEDALAACSDSLDIPLASLETLTNMNALAEVFGNFTSASGDIRNGLANFFCSTPELQGMVRVYAIFKVGNGMSVHPTPAGHDNIATAVIEAYESGYTAADKTVDNLKAGCEAIADLIAEYYDEALAYGYQYAKDNGYVDQAIEALDQLEDQLYDMAAWVEANGDQMGAELKAALVDEIDAAIASIEELKALLGATDAPAQQAAVAAALSLEEGVQTYSSEQGVAALSCDIESHLANIASLIESASADLGEAALAELKAMGDQACAKLQAMIPVVEQCLAEKLQAAAEYLKDKLGDAYTSFVEAARDAAAEYAPGAAQALYDYLLNNPEQVISFFAEYGPYVVDFFGEHASAIAEIVEYVSANYGEQALEYVFDNAGQILKAMVWVVENYGDEAWELIKVYMSASGADQAVSDLYEQLLGYGDELYNAALMQLKSSLAQLDVQIAASFAGLMDNLEALGAETAEAVLAEVAKAQLKIDAVVAEISDMIACGNVAVDELEAKVAELEAILDELEASLDGADEEVAAAVASEIEKARAYVAELKAAISADLANSMYEATHGEYVITEGSQYVALGDATITGDGSYADQLAAQIEAKASENGVSLGESWFTKLASEGLLAEDFAAFVEENSEAIAAADLISISMGQENLTTFVNKSLLAFESNGSVDFDWSVYVGSDGVAYVEQVLDMIKAELAEEMGAAYADMAASVVEAYAYGYVGFATNYFKVLDQIQSINPDAQVVVVGLNNAFGADTTLDLSLVGVEDEIEIGKYASYVVASTDLQYLAYAMIAGDDDVTFVSAPAAQTSVSGMGKLGILNITSKLEDTAAWMPSAEGQGYVLGQINDAMTFSVEGSSESASIEDAVVAPIADQVYTSKNIEPAVTVELDGARLTEGTDFTVVYFDNVEVGTATALVEGEGSYEGTVEATFEIVHLATAASFTDFVEGEWYLVETDGRGSFTGQRTLFMDYVLANGLMSGYKTNGVLNGLFGPHDNLTRAQAATILYRIANPDSTATDDPAAYAQENTTGLSDVEAGRYYTAAVNWCQENGVITGYKNTDTGEYYAFGSEDNVTREQLATMIYRFCVEYNGVEGAAADLSSFDDAGKISGYAQEAMAFCYANGVMTGRYGMNSIDPLGKSERCEVSKMIAVSTRDLLGL